jgi:hypothetical protein
MTERGGRKYVSIRARTLLLDRYPRLERLGLEPRKSIWCFCSFIQFQWARSEGLISGVRPHQLRTERRSSMIPTRKRPRERLSCSKIPEPWGDRRGRRMASGSLTEGKGRIGKSFYIPGSRMLGHAQASTLIGSWNGGARGLWSSGFAYWTDRAPATSAGAHCTKIRRSSTSPLDFSL